MIRSTTVSANNLLHHILVSGLEHGMDLKGSEFSSPVDSNKLSVPVWQTPHYAVLKGRLSLEDYESYVALQDEKEHSASSFLNLSSQLAKTGGNFESEVIVGAAEHPGKYRVIDGNHRLACYAAQSTKRTIPRRLIQGIPSVEEVSFDARTLARLKRALRKADKSRIPGGWSVARGIGYGYHSFHLGGLVTPGQRNPVQRLQAISEVIDLSGKSVLDLGCSTGGMLFHLPDPALAIGWDIDERAINFAKLLARLISKHAPEFAARFQFKVLDFDGSFENILGATLRQSHFDYVFLLSLGSWVEKWPLIYRIVWNSGAQIILETNNDDEGASQLLLFRNLGAHIVEIPGASADDVTGNLLRRTFLVRRPQN